MAKKQPETASAAAPLDVTEFEVLWVSVGSLVHNPKNYRRHDEAHILTLRQSLREHGWQQVVTVDPRDHTLILDGHGRELAAKAEGLARMPVHVYTGTNPEKWIVTANESDRQATVDQTALAALLADIQQQSVTGLAGTGVTDSGLDKLCADLAKQSPPTPVEPPEKPLPDIGDEMPPALDFQFTTEPEWGIPILDPTMQLQGVVAPCIPWGSIARTSRMAGTWHFYTEDYKFGALWQKPEPVVLTSCYGAIEPNWSVCPQTPRAVGLYNTFRKRWIARYWQSCGVRIAVDLGVDAHCAEVNVLGVPDGWQAFATRGYTDLMKVTTCPGGKYDIACRIAGHDHPLFVVVGGGKQVQALCGDRGWTYIGEEMDRNG